jgi:hypothetical protein
MPALKTGNSPASIPAGAGTGRAARLMIRSGGWREPTASSSPLQPWLPIPIERKDPMMNAVNPDFFDFVNYNFCRAISEHVGREQAAQVFERAGEIGYATLKAQGVIQTEGQSALDVLVQIVRFLETNGYMGRIELDRISETEMQVDMYQVSVMDSSVQLTDQGYSPSHIMTNLMFAALKEFGMSVQLAELGFEPEADHVREHWKLSPAG